MNVIAERTDHPILSQPVTRLKGIGPKLQEKLTKLHLHTVGDLIMHLPLRYEDRTRILPPNEWQDGAKTLFQGTVTASKVRYAPKMLAQVTLLVDNVPIQLVFFHFSKSQLANLHNGTTLRCFGELSRQGNGWQCRHPEYTLVTEDTPPLVPAIVPIYPTTQGLSTKRLSDCIQQALQLYQPIVGIEPEMPSTLRDNYELISFAQALYGVHQPSGSTAIEALNEKKHPAWQRLAVDELIAHRYVSLQGQQENARRPATAYVPEASLTQRFTAQLPFELTPDQDHVLSDIRADMAKQYPMRRLLQGDVGAGKTVVAALAMCAVIAKGDQVCLMAPTEILAEQHFESLKEWFEPLGVAITLLTGKLSKKVHQSRVEALASGDISIAVGTHALFQKGVSFQSLGLNVIDEQHRFGVAQRIALQARGEQSTVPHQLMMTATPIPRTLAMTLYADMSVSVIRHRPPGRQPIETVAVPNRKREALVEKIQQVVADGQQVYWVCPLVNESEVLNAQAAENTFALLTEWLAPVPVGLVHGQLPADDKAKAMGAFVAGDTKVLVATTVIEVGVNVPNATLMVIENPERLGLAQLHQLRGRVGRSSLKSYCILLYEPPLSKSAEQKLGVLRDSNDGFVVAEKDLALRGPGEIMGTRQTGAIGWRAVVFPRDSHWLIEISSICDQLFDEVPAYGHKAWQRWFASRECFTHS